MNFAALLQSGPTLKSNHIHRRGNRENAEKRFIEVIGQASMNALQIAAAIGTKNKTAATYLLVLEKRGIVTRIGTEWLGKGRPVVIWKLTNDRYQSLEQEHLGDFDKKTGIYSD